jgi:hypothetical protein
MGNLRCRLDEARYWHSELHRRQDPVGGGLFRCWSRDSQMGGPITRRDAVPAAKAKRIREEHHSSSSPMTLSSFEGPLSWPGGH